MIYWGLWTTPFRTTYQPTGIMRWDRGIFDGSCGVYPMPGCVSVGFTGLGFSWGSHLGYNLGYKPKQVGIWHDRTSIIMRIYPLSQLELHFMRTWKDMECRCYWTSQWLGRICKTIWSSMCSTWCWPAEWEAEKPRSQSVWRAEISGFSIGVWTTDILWLWLMIDMYIK